MYQNKDSSPQYRIFLKRPVINPGARELTNFALSAYECSYRVDKLRKAPHQTILQSGESPAARITKTRSLVAALASNDRLSTPTALTFRPGLLSARAGTAAALLALRPFGSEDTDQWNRDRYVVQLILGESKSTQQAGPHITLGEIPGGTVAASGRSLPGTIVNLGPVEGKVYMRGGGVLAEGSLAQILADMS